MTASAGKTIDLSMNEIEMTALKAARGAGLPWSIAEDAGRAARWLAGQDIGWSGLLLEALEPEVALDPDASPFLVGARLSDRLDGLAAGEEAGVSVLKPVWLVAMLAVNVAGPGGFLLSVGGECFSLAEGTASGSVALADLATIERADVALRLGEKRLAHALAPGGTRSIIPISHHAALEVLVYRTYVPNSEKSRLRGAGARPGF